MNQYSTTLDTTIAFRAIAIVAIVMFHLKLLGQVGAAGAIFLLFLAGYNFATFTLPKAEKIHSKNLLATKAYFKYCWKIFLPSAMYLLIIFILLGRFHVHSILMISNFQDASYGDGIRYWFIEVLLQIVLLTCVFLSVFKACRNYMFAKPYNFFLLSSVIFFLVRVCTWDYSVSSGLLNATTHQLPNISAFVFFTGGLIACSKDFKQQVFSSIVVSALLLVPIIAGQARKDFLVLIFSALILLWIKEIKVLTFMKSSINTIAFASLFIYLVHFQVISTFENFTTSAVSRWLAVLVSISLGIIGKSLWTRTIKILPRYSYLMGKIIWV